MTERQKKIKKHLSQKSSSQIKTSIRIGMLENGISSFDVLAKKVGCSRMNLFNIMNKKQFSRSCRVRIAKVLKTPYESIFGELGGLK